MVRRINHELIKREIRSKEVITRNVTTVTYQFNP